MPDKTPLEIRGNMDAKEIAEKIQISDWLRDATLLATDYLRLRAENEALKETVGAMNRKMVHMEEQIADLTRQRNEAQAWSITALQRMADVEIADKEQIKDLTTRAEAAERSIAEFIPDSAHINVLPDKLRSYIHDIETKCDPAGDIQARRCAEESASALCIQVQELSTRAEAAEKDSLATEGRLSAVIIRLEIRIAAMRNVLASVEHNRCQHQTEPHCAHCRKPKDRHFWGDKWSIDGACKDYRGRPNATVWTPVTALLCNCIKSRALAALQSTPEPGTAEWVKQQAAKLGITPAEWAKAYCDITPEQVRALRRDQAISFAYGNVKMHNPDLTRESVAAEYDKLAALQTAPEPKP